MSVPILVNTPLMAPDSVGIATTSMMPIAAAMRPYSMAVTPDSSFTKRTSLFICYSDFQVGSGLLSPTRRRTHVGAEVGEHALDGARQRRHRNNEHDAHG